MRTKPASRFNTTHQHASFGIYNYLRNKKGIKNQETINEVCYAFCMENGMEKPGIDNEIKRINFIQNRFQKFAQFSGQYLKENNYV